MTPRARLPRVLGRSGQVVWVTDTGGDQALEIAPATPFGDGPAPAGGATGAAGAATAAGPASSGEEAGAAGATPTGTGGALSAGTAGATQLGMSPAPPPW